MPLNKSCSLDALEKNIAAEIRAGRPRAQAVAVAHRTLRDACRREGNPTPTRKSDRELRHLIEKRERSNEYLEEVLRRARKLLNPRDFAVLFQAARASAGGQIAAKRRITAAEKMLAEQSILAEMNDAEIEEVAKTINEAFRRNDRAGRSNDRVIDTAARLVGEAEGTGVELRGPAFMAGREEIAKRVKSAQEINDLPDEAFAVVLPGGTKDESGKTVPRSLRKLPYKNAEGSIDKAHLRNALARLNQTDMPAEAKSKAKARLDAAAKENLPSSEAARQKKTKKSLSLRDAVAKASEGELIDPPVFVMEAPGNMPSIGANEGDMIDLDHTGLVIGLSESTVADTEETIAKALREWATIEKHSTAVPFSGPDNAILVFVAAHPSELELARGAPIVGDDALTFKSLYLDPLGMEKTSVAIGFAMPVIPHDDPIVDQIRVWSEQLKKSISRYQSAKAIVSLGKIAKAACDEAGIETTMLPHPSPVRKKGDSGEVKRKLQKIAKSLDVSMSKMAQSKHAPIVRARADLTSKLQASCRKCRITKAADEKQIVYGVVLDPYEIDLQQEWVPPSEIESTSHGFMKKSRVIGFEHMKKADAQLVESWLVPYPSDEDYRKAMRNEPHVAYVMRFGDDDIHSGAWVAGVQMSDDLWAMHKSGKLNSFSVGGFSFKTKITAAEMPKVEFVRVDWP